MQRSRFARFLILSLGLAAGAASPPLEDPRLVGAQTLLEAGSVAEAERAFRRVLADRPLSAAAYLGLARALVAGDRPGEAVERLRAGGERLLRAGRYDGAVGLAEEALALAPDSADTLQLLGRALVLERSFLRAERVLRRAVELGRTDHRTLIYLGSTLWENGELGESEAVLARAARMAGGANLATAHLGRLLLFQGRFGEAVPRLRRAVQAAPQSVELWFALARALEGAGEREAAIAAYRQAADMDAGYAPARYGLGRLLLAAGERAGAERELAAYRALYLEEQRRNRQEGLERARIDRALDLARRQQVDEALRELGGLPETGETLAALGRIHAAAGDLAAAARALERSLLLLPERRDLQALLAEVRLAAEGEP